jgi:hypothetical protein
MDSSQVAALLAKTAKAAQAGQFELYKTSHHFDGTVANPQWLGEERNAPGAAPVRMKANSVPARCKADLKLVLRSRLRRRRLTTSGE